MEEENKGQAVDVTDDEFESRVLRSELPVVVDFWAPWCGPCRMIEPIIRDLAQEYEGQIRVVRVNTDDNQAYATEYRIMGIPTMIFFRDGEEIDRVVGALPKPALQERFETLVSETKAAQG